jgi:hypothetical protein
MTKRVILLDIEPDDYLLAVRAVRRLIDRPESKEAVVGYDGYHGGDFYVRRNKASITVRQCQPHKPDMGTTND